MGFIQRSSGPPNFSKAVISLWFRVPSASLTDARAQFNAATAVFPNTDFGLAGVIPLVTFGPNSEIYTIYNGSSAPTSSGAISPCVIGISCGSYTHDGTYRNTMYARMQYSTGAPAVGPLKTVYNDFFQVGSRIAPSNVFGSPGAGNYIIVTADKWHHILVSFDLSGGCSSTYSSPNLTINSTCPFHWAFDDVNYSSAYLWPNTPQVVGNADVPNGIYSDRCNQNTGSYNFAAGNITTATKPFGFPSSSGNSAKIYKIETAKLQFFTGVTLDTSIEANRRAFVTADGVPADPSLGAALLGVPPIVQFKKSSDWINGANSGTIGTFTPTGTILRYDQSPSL